MIIMNKKQHQPEALQTEVLSFIEPISRLIFVTCDVFLVNFFVALSWPSSSLEEKRCLCLFRGQILRVLALKECVFLVMDIREGCPHRHSCFFSCQGLEGLTQVFDQMSAGMSGNFFSEPPLGNTQTRTKIAGAP